MFARTARLLLRPGWIEDAPALAEALDDPRIARNSSQIPWPYGLANARAWLGREADALPSLLILAREGGSARLVGGVGLRRDAAGGDAELGYWIRPDRWGRGYATEAARAAIELARRSLMISRLVSGHFVDNPASGRVLRKLGFRPTGQIVRRWSAARRQPVDCALFASEEESAVGEFGQPLAA